METSLIVAQLSKAMFSIKQPTHNAHMHALNLGYVEKEN